MDITIKKYDENAIESLYAVADPGFPRWGAPTPDFGLCDKIFAESCTKMKEIGPIGGGMCPYRPRGQQLEFFRIEFCRIYRICRKLFSVVSKMKITKNSLLKIL